MYELQWFKVDANIFSNRKIKILLSQKDGDTYFRVWIQLIAIAIECNSSGRLQFGENNPMTIQNFSKIMGKSKKKTERIIESLLKLEMLIKDEDTYIIKNWNKYQSIDKLTKIEEQNRKRQAKYREKLKSEKEKSNVKVTLGNVTEEKIIDKEITKENNQEEESENGFRRYGI